MKSNMTKTEAKQAFRHSIFYLTVFDFSAMEYKDQGEYTCIFGVNISSASFCSVPSKPLQITVTGETLMNAWVFLCLFAVIIASFLFY